ncbi:hypothetical protein MLD38_013099 [Melastoma candidum]|uniref:Uncharacterized protein n=1 Tax=Melastoma candidum TaxID=119954 RepID=A0ACB9RC43_9MYRT|nr:hypothetical protein MLD38_013099 [Melastoma candidum]
MAPEANPGALRSSSFPGEVNTTRKGGGASVSVPRDSASLVFRNLDADDFRHPLDKQNTLIKGDPWVERSRKGSARIYDRASHASQEH